MASTNIVDLVGTLIENIRDTHAIISITNVGNTYTINTAETHSLAVGDYVKISGTDYKIITLTNDTKFTVTSTTAITGTIWTALAPYYFYGTPIMIANTIDKITDYQNKYPVIVLFETMPADSNDGYIDKESPIERTVALEMYFMDEANYSDWASEDYYSNVINDMQTLVDSFIAECQINVQIGSFTKHKETNYSKWNLVRLDTGKNVFNAQLSGIGLNISLPIKKYHPTGPTTMKIH
jgi:hypothetical protein